MQILVRRKCLLNMAQRETFTILVCLNISRYVWYNARRKGCKSHLEISTRT